MENLLVSAVIPTRNRADLVCRAVRSALCQTYSELEVLVVIDGPDPVTVVALESMQETRLRIIALEKNVGSGEARNIGVQQAKGEWVAFLDDDDEWLPSKIEKQMELAVIQTRNDILITSLYLDRNDQYEVVQPKRFPRSNQHISEYLFCEMSIWGQRKTFLQTSTWLVERSYMLKVPFTVGLGANDDTDWLLRAIHDPALQLVFVQDTLAIFHSSRFWMRMSIAKKGKWARSRAWVIKNQKAFTHEAFSYFLVTFCLRDALKEKAGIHVYLFLLKDCLKYGRVTLGVLWIFLCTVLLVPLAKHYMPANMLMALRRGINE